MHKAGFLTTRLLCSLQSLKFWRSRFFLLPCNNLATKKIIEGSPRCDIYEEKTSQELKQLIMGFTRYIEVLNKMKRTQTTRQQKTKVNSLSWEILNKMRRTQTTRQQKTKVNSLSWEILNKMRRTQTTRQQKTKVNSLSWEILNKMRRTQTTRQQKTKVNSLSWKILNKMRRTQTRRQQKIRHFVISYLYILRYKLGDAVAQW